MMSYNAPLVETSPFPSHPTPKNTHKHLHLFPSMLLQLFLAPDWDRRLPTCRLPSSNKASKDFEILYI